MPEKEKPKVARPLADDVKVSLKLSDSKFTAGEVFHLTLDISGDVSRVEGDLKVELIDKSKPSNRWTIAKLSEIRAANNVVKCELPKDVGVGKYNLIIDGQYNKEGSESVVIEITDVGIEDVDFPEEIEGPLGPIEDPEEEAPRKGIAPRININSESLESIMAPNQEFKLYFTVEGEFHQDNTFIAEIIDESSGGMTHRLGKLLNDKSGFISCKIPANVRGNQDLRILVKSDMPPSTSALSKRIQCIRPTEPEPRSPQSEDESDTIPIIDPNNKHIFIFGVASSGKTALLGSFLYFLDKYREDGDTFDVDAGDGDKEHELLGHELYHELKGKIGKGIFPNSTQRLVADQLKYPRLLHCYYESVRLNKDFRFSLMDVSGEDFEQIKPKTSRARSSMSSGITDFLNIAPNNFMSIIIFPKKSEKEKYDIEEFLMRFLNTLDKKGLGSAPILLVISKWDIKLNDGTSSDCEAFVEEYLPSVWRKLSEKGRDVGFMPYSVGEVNEDNRSFVFSKESPLRLFKWVFEKCTGKEFSDSDTWFKELLRRLKSRK